VVSRSSTTNVTSRSGVPSSSNDSWGERTGTAADASARLRQDFRTEPGPTYAL
jgi:hypothetical protein